MDDLTIKSAVENNDPTLAREALEGIEIRLRSTSDRNQRAYLSFSKASCYGILGRFKEARMQLKLALQETQTADSDGQITFDFMEAMLLQREGRYKEALGSFDAALQQHSKRLNQAELRFMYEDIQDRRGFLLVQLNRFQEAIPVLRECLSFASQDSSQEIHLSLGFCYDGVALTELAKQEYLNAISFSVRNVFEAQARYRLALLYFQSGAFAQSKYHLELILSAQIKDIPNLPMHYVYQLLSQSCARLGEEENATRYRELARL